MDGSKLIDAFAAEVASILENGRAVGRCELVDAMTLHDATAPVCTIRVPHIDSPKWLIPKSSPNLSHKHEDRAGKKARRKQGRG